MKRYPLELLIVLAVIGLARFAGTAHAAPATTATAAAASSAAQPPVVADVLKVFAARCAECHDEATYAAKNPGKTLSTKKNKFGYVLDLARLRAEPKYVVPGDAAKSKLFEQVAKDEMPPPDDADPCSAPEKETIKAWIAAGAPAQVTAVASATTTNSNEAHGPTSRPARTFGAKLVKWLGNFHPLAAHTPIACTMAAALAEMLYLRRRQQGLTGASRFSMILAAAGAVVTASLGWAMAADHSQSDLLDRHRWTGTIAGIASIPVALLALTGGRRARREGVAWEGFSRWVFRIGVFGITGFVGFAAHLGGLVHWGDDLFAWPK